MSNNGGLMKIVEYYSANNMIVEFQDKFKMRTKTAWKEFNSGRVRNPIDKMRVGRTNINYQGCPMIVVEYKSVYDVTVEFQGDYPSKVHSDWKRFVKGSTRNPMFPSVYGVGITGNKYPTMNGNVHTKEYKAWNHMLERCYSKFISNSRNNTYIGCSVCDEWLYYPNFYEWLHKQPNFEKFINGKFWAIDKDIIQKGNKVYCPKLCCLVPPNVNSLFAKSDAIRGEYLIGVSYNKNNNMLFAQCKNPLINKNVKLGEFSNEHDAFLTYKRYKEKLIKEIAEIEYSKENISLECYLGMKNYIVEDTD